MLIGSCSQHRYTCMGKFQVERTKHLGHVTFGRVSDRTIRISWYEHNFIYRVLILIITLYQFPKSVFLASLGIISLSEVSLFFYSMPVCHLACYSIYRIVSYRKQRCKMFAFQWTPTSLVQNLVCSLFTVVSLNMKIPYPYYTYQNVD